MRAPVLLLLLRSLKNVLVFGVNAIPYCIMTVKRELSSAGLEAFGQLE